MKRDVAVFYHDPCDDGFASRWAAWKKLGDNAEYIGAHHDMAMPDVSGQEVYLLDICFDRDRLDQLGSRAKKITILDHHKSAQDKVGDYPGAHFDMTKSGALLSWEHFHPGVRAPALIACVSDSDLWQFKMPETRGFIRNLRSRKMDIAQWDAIALLDEEETARFVREGVAMDRCVWEMAERIADQASPCEINGRLGLGVNAGGEVASEVGSILAERSGSFGLVWSIAKSGEAKCSLRSAGDWNTIPLAESFGGGGHPNASGFRASPVAVLELFQKARAKL